MHRDVPLTLNIQQLAMLPIVRLMNQDNPFTRCTRQDDLPKYHGDSSSRLPGTYREVINAGLWGYQIHTYLVLIRRKFGPEVESQVREHQLAALEKDGAMAITHILSLIDSALTMGTVTIPGAGSDLDIPLEMNVALTLLLSLHESPDHTPDSTRHATHIQTMPPAIDWRLADCLCNAREEIMSTFIPMLAGIVLDQSSETNP